MPLPVIANTWRVTLNYRGAAPKSHTVNVIHLRATTAQLATAQANLLAALTAGGVNMVDPLTSDFVLQDSDWLDLAGTGVAVHLDHTGHLLTGQASSNYAPQVAYVVSLQTARRGRSYRGRLYVGPVGTDHIHDGELTTANATAVSGAWANFATSLSSAGTPTPMVVASYKHATSDLVVNIIARKHLATQRRRQRAFG